MGRASSDVFLRSVYDQLVMRGEMGRPQVCDSYRGESRLRFLGSTCFGVKALGVVSEEEYAKIAVYDIVTSFLKVKAIFHLRLRLIAAS